MPLSVKRKPASEAQIRKACVQVYKETVGKPPNKVDAEQAIRRLLPTATRKKIRPILEEPQFAKLRLPPGNSPQR
jgi:hypothetical protein